MDKETVKTYSKNFITKVIFRLDYEEAADIENESLDGIRGKMSGLFANFEQEKFFVSTIEFKEGLQNPVTKSSKLWILRDETGTETLAVNKDFLTLEVSSYANFTKFFGRVNSIFSLLRECYTLGIVKRVGLRYVNEIKIDESNPTDWQNYIQKELIAPIHFFDSKEGELARELVQISLNKEDCSIGLVAGMWNSEYPVRISKKEFILDIDCRTLVPIDASEVLQKTKTLNEYATNVFERTILEKFKTEFLA